MAKTPPSHASLAQLTEGYWTESRRPLASLVFLVPLLVLYESGVLLFGVQNGADVFMRRVLDLLGFGQHFLLPILTVGLLLAWNHVQHQPWRLSGGIVSAMAAESIFLAVVLWLISVMQNILFAVLSNPLPLSIGGNLKQAIGYLGAGIYEELLFRLVLLSLTAWVFRRARMKAARSMLTAAILTSLAFSVAHHVGPYGEPFRWFAFTFRFLAGMFFSVVFTYRGFGIAAGSHAAYDILVGFLASI
jgi:membrane protease YdiL (CAAX protease family)